MSIKSGRLRLSIHWKWWASSLCLVFISLVIANSLIHYMTDHRSQTSQILWLFFLTFLAASLISLPAVFFISRRMTHPLHEMMKAADRIGQEDFSGKILIHPKNELGEFGETFNRMANKLAARLKETSEDQLRLSAVLDGMTEGVMVLDRQGKVLKTNPALDRMFALASPLPIEIYYYELIRHYELNELIKEVLAQGTGYAKEIDFGNPRDQVFQVQASLARTEGIADKAYAVFVFHDITTLRRLERIRKDFVDNVSHELKTPLTSIKGYIEALIDLGPGEQEKEREFLSVLQRHSQSMENIVADLLLLARIESGKDRIDLQNASLTSFLQKTAYPLLSEAAKKQQTIVFQSEEGLSIKADLEKLAQVVTNLLDNAIKYTPESGRIIVGGRTHQKGVELFVTDNGIGIPRVDQQRIFERFYRVDRDRSRALGGTGLGLAIVKHIMELHGGSITVESQPGAGTTFVARFPNDKDSKRGNTPST